MIQVFRALLLRELRAVRREIEAYPDDEAPWALPPGWRNSGGILALHLAGNLRHFVGAVLGGSGYERDRDAEFARRGLSRADLLGEIDGAAAAVDRNIAVNATARGFSLSRLLLRVRFGRSRRTSPSYRELEEDYLARLAAGAGATGRFVPRLAAAAGEQSPELQPELLARWRRVNRGLRSALLSWSERDLDRVQLPHPLLGKIPARELVFFTIHHGPHHVASAKRRLPRFAAGGSA